MCIGQVSDIILHFMTLSRKVCILKNRDPFLAVGSAGLKNSAASTQQFRARGVFLMAK